MWARARSRRVSVRRERSQKSSAADHSESVRRGGCGLRRWSAERTAEAQGGIAALSDIEGADALAARRVGGDIQAFAERDGPGAVQDLAQGSAGGVADGGMKEA